MSLTDRKRFKRKYQRKHLKFLIYILLFLAYSQLIYSQEEIKTDEIKVISAGENALLSPSRINVLNKNDIKDLNGSNLSEILNSVSGIFIKSYGSSSSLQTISMNGLGAEHTSILLNGSKLNSFQNGLIDLSLIPTLNIKKIEILNNGFSSLFGSESIGGVINIVTESNSGEAFKFDLNTAYGSYNRKSYGLKISKSFKSFDLNASVSDDRSDNEYAYYFDNGIDKELKNRAGAGYNTSDFSLSAQNIFSPEFKASFYTQLTDSKRDLPGIETGYPAPSSQQTDKNWNNILQLNYSGKGYNIISDLNFQNNLMNYHTQGVINSYYKNLLYSNSSRIEINKKENTYTLGTEVKYGTIESKDLNEGVNRKQFSIFNSNNIKWNELLIYPSIRFDHITDIDKSAVTYRLGLNYKPIKNADLYVRGNAGRNFRVPTFNDLYWTEGGNPGLKPEYSQNYEAGISFQSGTKLNYVIDVSMVHIDLKDRIVWLPHRNSIWSPENIGLSESNTFISSLVLSYNFEKNISVKTELSYTDNSSIKRNEDFPGDPSTGKQIIYIPLNQIRSSVEFKAGKLGVNLFYSYLGKRFSDSENLNILSPVNLLDGNIFYDFIFSKYKAGLKLELNNITNTDYQVISGYPTPLRNFKLNLNIGYSL